ncbi:PAS domain S-box protein [Candidatus Gottesmanbacteria bacterium]|nr:PAS domain S-box protein [Candidatus Gottesmanbacteria bacterium]
MEKPAKPLVQNFLLSFIVFVFFLSIPIAFTLIAWKMSVQTIESQRNEKFLHAIDFSRINIQDRVKAYQNIFSGFSALHAAHGDFSYTEWSGYAKHIRDLTSSTGVSVVAYDEVVLAEEKNQFITKLQTELPGGTKIAKTIFPESVKNEYTVSKYIEPLEGNEIGIGYDFSSEKERYSAMIKARDSGQLALTGRIASILDKQGVYSIVPVYPIYSHKMALDTREDRRSSVIGYIVGKVNVDDFFRRIFEADFAEMFHFDVEDVTENNAPVTLFSDDKENKNRTQSDLKKYTLTVDAGGRVWNFRFIPKDSAFVLTPSQKLLMIAIFTGGAVGTILMATVGIFIIIGNQRVERRVLSMTEELRTFKLAVENTNDYVIITDKEGVIKYMNRMAEVLTGYTFAESHGQTPRLWGRQMGQKFYEHLWHTIKTEQKSFIGELVNKRKDGELFHVLATISPLIDEEKALVGFVGIGKDITESKKIALKLARQEEYYRALLDSCIDLITVLDDTGVIQYENAASLPALGYAPEELVGKNVFSLDLYEEKEKVKGAFESMSKGADSHETMLVKIKQKDGSSRILESVGRMVMVDGKSLLISSSRDVTKRINGEDALRRKTQELETVNMAMLGRELKLSQATKKIAELEEKLGLAHDRGEEKKDGN